MALSVYIANTSGTLKTEAAKDTSNESVIYDVENVMAYIAASMSEEGTLIYAHFNHDTSDEEVTCLSCHDIYTLRQLYLLCDPIANAYVGKDMLDSSTEICLTCHGSYAELIELTKDSVALHYSEGITVNPHDTMMGELACLTCHSGHNVSAPASNALDYCYVCHVTELFHMY